MHLMDSLARVLLAGAALLVCCHAMTNQEVYPGLRRPPSAKISAASSSNSYDEKYLSQIFNYIEEQARRKYQEKLKSFQSMPRGEDSEVNSWDEDTLDGDFTFKMPSPVKGKIPQIDEPFDFGVAPNDPRFYENSPATVDKQLEVARSDSAEKSASAEGQGQPYMRLKDPLIVNPKPDPNSFYKSQQMQGLLHKWGRNNNNNNNNLIGGALDPRFGIPIGHGQEVVQRPMNLSEQTSISVYGVALIAGVSAAITVALIALGLGWWTFYKKSKAAQDVEYPAYGVTGPNKEKLSPTSGGDRRLAQNAQMYHYQHQKQQIIAMESKMNEDRNGSLSDAGHSDDEEGDYTVYECPGLAPTGGDMEVKNPLFFDDPTPTPGKGQQVVTSEAGGNNSGGGDAAENKSTKK